MNMTNECIYYDLNAEIEKFRKINEENKDDVDTINRYKVVNVYIKPISMQRYIYRINDIIYINYTFQMI